MTVMKYPEPLDDPQDVSPDLVMLWAKTEVLKTEIQVLEQRLKEKDDESIEEEKRLKEEQIPKVKQHLE